MVVHKLELYRLVLFHKHHKMLAPQHHLTMAQFLTIPDQLQHAVRMVVRYLLIQFLDRLSVHVNTIQQDWLYRAIVVLVFMEHHIHQQTKILIQVSA
jgi:hypothetical protein